LMEFEAVLAHAQSLVQQGQLDALTMRDVAELYKAGRWTGLGPDT
jgi:hypothetical protein